MKEGLSKKAPTDPHQWLQRPAHLIDPDNWFVLRDDLSYWICPNCATITMVPPETMHEWPLCKEKPVA